MSLAKSSTFPVRILQKLYAAGICLAIAALPYSSDASGTAVLRIGVGHLPPPPGPTDIRLYTPEGFDVFLAEQIAKQLGKQVELVELPETERAAALESRKVDLVLGRVRDGDPLLANAKIIGAGFRSGATVAMRTDTNIKEWGDLAGRTVCVSRGNADGQAIAARHHAIVRVEEVPAQSLMLVRTGVCDAAIHDEILLKRLFEEDGWQKFSATLPATDQTELAAAVGPENGMLADSVRVALAQIASKERWDTLEGKWAENVAFEVYLDQDAPDCH